MTKLETQFQDHTLARYGEVIALDASPSVIVTVQGEIAQANPRAENLCPSARLAACLQTPENLEQLMLAQRSTAPRLARLILQDSDGDPLPVRARLARLPARTAHPLLLIRMEVLEAEDPFQRVRSDNAQLQRAIQARKRSDKRFRQFLNSAVDGIGAVAENGQITMANAALSTMLGVSGLIGKSLFDYVDMIDLRAQDHGFETPSDPAAFLSRLIGAPHEAYIQSEARDRYPVELTVTPIEEPGLRQFVVVLRDITARREYKEALARSQYLEAARDIARANEQTKTQFLATVSHEMRTPMGAIATAADLLLNDAKLAPEHRQLLEVVRGSADTALEQINDTLEHVRMDLRPIKDHPVSAFSPAEVLQKLAGQSRIAAEAKGLTVSLNLNCPAAIQVAGYHHLFHRVVQNLLGNAVKYTDQGDITLSADCEIQRSPGAANIVAVNLEVADTGRGIAPEQIERLFSPFETGNNSFDTLAQSAGLGLSIVKRAVDAMGGAIRVSSTPGAGSRFQVNLRFGLPATQAVAEAAPTQKPLNTKGFRFLVVDDNPLNRQLMTKLLDSEGCVAITAENGEDALAEIAEHEVDAVLMDIGLPGIDGLETTRRMLQRPALAQLPVFGLTGFSDPEVRERAELAGMNHVYVKPLRRNQLHEVVHRIINGASLDAPRQPRPVEVLKQDVARQIAKISGDNWSVFVHQLHKECAVMVGQMRDALQRGALADILETARRGSTTAATVGAIALHQTFLEIEEQAKADQASHLPATIERSEELLEQTRLALTLL